MQELQRIHEELRMARRLLSDESVAGSSRAEAGRLLEQVDQSLRDLALAAENGSMANRFLTLRSTLSAHLSAAATFGELVASPSSAEVDALRRAADKTRAGLEAFGLTG